MSRTFSLWIGLLLVTLTSVRADDWPQWLGPQRDGVWRETGIVDRLPAKGLTRKWTVPIGSGYAGPAVVGDHVYVTDRIITEGTDSANPFERKPVPSSERVLCLNRESGEIIWKHAYPCVYTVSYPAGPRCTPTVSGDKVIRSVRKGICFASEPKWETSFGPKT